MIRQKRLTEMTPEEIEKYGEGARQEMLNIAYNPANTIPQRREEYKEYQKAYRIMTAREILLSEERERDLHHKETMENISELRRIFQDKSNKSLTFGERNGLYRKEGGEKALKLERIFRKEVSLL